MRSKALRLNQIASGARDRSSDTVISVEWTKVVAVSAKFPVWLGISLEILFRLTKEKCTHIAAKKTGQIPYGYQRRDLDISKPLRMPPLQNVNTAVPTKQAIQI